jgi:hypothetical protein
LVTQVVVVVVLVEPVRKLELLQMVVEQEPTQSLLEPLEQIIVAVVVEEAVREQTSLVQTVGRALSFLVTTLV